MAGMICLEDKPLGSKPYRVESYMMMVMINLERVYHNKISDVDELKRRINRESLWARSESHG